MKNSLSGNKVVVIGSGIGGLSAGILLALDNYKVTVVERNPLPGGLMRSYNRLGMDCPVGVHYVGALGENEPLGMLFQALGLPVRELFSPMGQDGIIDRYIFDDFVFDLPVSLDGFEVTLRNSFPEDSATIDAIMPNLRDISQRFTDPSFLIGQSDPFQNMDYYLPMGEYLNSMGVSAKLRSVLAVPCNLIGVPLDDCPVIFHHMVLASYLFSSWKLKEGGRQMTDVLVRRLQETGGELLLNHAVRTISVAQSTVTGVILESGEHIPADAVIFAIHPKMMLNMLDENVLRDTYRRRLRGLKETESVLGVQVKVDAKKHPEIHHNIYRLHANDQGMIENGVFYQLRGSLDPAYNLLSIITQSLYEDWHPWEDTVSGQRGNDYKKRKMTIAENLLKKAENVFGDLSDAEIMDTYTPLTIRDYVNVPEGACYGIKRSSRQLLRAISLNNVPVGGLYLAGQNALAPGVMGCVLGSFNVARQVMGAKKAARKSG